MKLGSISFKYLFICLCSLLLFLTTCENISYADPGQKLVEKFGQRESVAQSSDPDNEVPFYFDTYIKFQEQGLDKKTVEDVKLEYSQARISKGSINNVLVDGNDEMKSPYILWNEDIEWLEWDVQVGCEGLYELEIQYCPVEGGTGRDIERSLYIDGKSPFKEAESIVLYRLWQEAAEPRFNNIGDEVWPAQKEVIRWNSSVIYDKIGMHSNPLKFYLSKGHHTIRLSYTIEPVMLGEVRFIAPHSYKSYSEIAEEYLKENVSKYSGNDIRFEAEKNVVEKNSLTIRREVDDDPATYPISRGARRLNVFGGWRWRTGNQSITWEFNVPEDGLYQIGIKVRQNNGNGLPVYRRIEIDGVVPFAELNAYRFPYHDKWQMVTLGNGDTDYLFHLTSGKHTFTMTVTMSRLADLLNSISKDSETLSGILQKVFKLTGSEPDPNFDYEFERNIPEMIPELKDMAQHMQDYTDVLNEICTQVPEITNLVSICKNNLELFLSDRYKMASRINDLKEMQGSMTSIYQALQNAPMAVDYFIVGKKDSAWMQGINSNFFQKAYTIIYNFFRSFFVDYDAINGMADEKNEEYKVLNVWVGRGAEWAETLKNLADERFTPKTGIVLNLNVIPASQLQTGAVNVLLLSLASGNAPDVASGVLASSPVEFAIRDAALDLRKFDDFDSVSRRFLPQLMVPFEYRNGVYALPETMNFRVMYYRKDIIKELGIKVPDTWDELCHNVLPVLYRNNMNFCFPPDFTPFLYQNAGAFYSQNGLTSALNTPEAFKAFNEFIFMYSGYGLPAVNLSFYQKFRSGETPMGIDNYETYLMFMCAAPELSGKWGIAPVPGTIREDKTIDRSIGGMMLGRLQSGQSAGIVDYSSVIFSDTGMKNEAWEFLKWWTSYETQNRYCSEIESLLGREGRWNTANIQAYKQIPWDKEHLKVMEEQWQWYKEVPVVLGGYFTPRHLNNAWTNAVLGGEKPRDAIEAAVKEINLELRRKQEEYGIYAGN